MPNLASNYSVWWNIGTVGGGETCIKWYNWVNSPYNSLTYDVFIQTAVCLFQLARTDPINDGDLFDICLSTFGDYIRIVQQGDGDRNQGVVAKFV